MGYNEAYNQHRRTRLSCEGAVDLLGISVSTFYRYRRRYEEEGGEGLADRRISKLSPLIIISVWRAYDARLSLKISFEMGREKLSRCTTYVLLSNYQLY